ncbi:molybdenum cofactor synthesis domain-containing protein [Desulfuromusa kysingii]|uniref:Molybdopterin molybdenumtransferase n=1 Tax=Desulfuromusa kysingii TaxID=37625 RepID=A0A1H4CW12_9BACT|nr:molybdopterin-binding protein [Desulfuromusa kysingii]SEA64663.1 molybdenum cofactor synthesis domain-containing protein [Desulfuromusa kysingii]
MKKLSLAEAVGETLGYDITEVKRSMNYKGVAFKRGHVIQEEDISVLQGLGKNHIYVCEEFETDVHEDTAATTLAPKIAGENISFEDQPREGKINFYAQIRGIFKVDYERLAQLNRLAIPSLPTIHNNFPVVKGKQVAAFRIIPLTCTRQMLEQMLEQVEQPLICVKPYKIKTAAILVTGNEVHSGRITDGFTPLLTAKLQQYGVTVTYTTILPDVKAEISQAVKKAAEKSDLVLVTGGSSVDPDDVTVTALHEAGVQFDEQGNPIQPGNNLTIGYINAIPVCAVPAAALVFEKTALDIFLPRILAGETISKEEIAKSGHGGLCHFCPKCHYPICPFGWGAS